MITEKFLGLAFLLFIFSCQPVEKKRQVDTDTERMDLKGEVKSVHQITYDIIEKFGKTEKGNQTHNYQMIFDKKGYIIEENNYSSNEDLTRKSTNKYGLNGKLLERNSYNSGGDLIEKIIHKYDENENMNVVEHYNSEGVLTSKSTSKYDVNGKQLERNNHNPKGVLTSKSTYKYHNNGNLSEQTDNYFNSEGNLYLTGILKFDKNENQTEGISFGKDKPVFKSIWELNENGNWIEKKGFIQEKFESRVTRAYNEQGNVTVEKSYDLSGSIENEWTYKYEYDITGNWISKTTFKNGLSQEIINREIKYFE